jgi:putative ABC transport system permease protein
MAEMLAGPRFTMTLFVAFAGLALLLATIGLYGVISYSVGQRTREIGVRIALGADASAVVGLVVRQGLGLTMAGVIVGLAGAAVGSRAMESMLFEVDRLDPLTFGGVALLLLLVTLLASYLPARRAALVDPVVALRSE